MDCVNCDAIVKENDKYCYKCGKLCKVESSSEQETQNCFINNPPSQNKQITTSTKNSRINYSSKIKTSNFCKIGLSGFLLSFILFIGSIPAMILSIISLRKIKQNGKKGKEFAIAGLIISVITLIVFFVLILSFIISTNFSSPSGGTL